MTKRKFIAEIVDESTTEGVKKSVLSDNVSIVAFDNAAALRNIDIEFSDLEVPKKRKVVRVHKQIDQSAPEVDIVNYKNIDQPKKKKIIKKVRKTAVEATPVVVEPQKPPELPRSEPKQEKQRIVKRVRKTPAKTQVENQAE